MNWCDMALVLRNEQSLSCVIALKRFAAFWTIAKNPLYVLPRPLSDMFLILILVAFIQLCDDFSSVAHDVWLSDGKMTTCFSSEEFISNENVTYFGSVMASNEC